MDYLCIFCQKNKLDENTIYEHVIPAALGGTIKSKKIVCSACNRYFNTNIDNPLIDAFLPFRVMFNIKSENCKHGPSMPLDGFQPEGFLPGYFQLKPGGELSRKQAKLDKNRELIQSDSEDASFRLLMHRLRQNGLKPDENLEKNLRDYSMSLTPRRKLVNQSYTVSFDIDRPEQLRCVAKIGFERLGLYDYQLAMDSQFNHIRAYIRYGEDSDACSWDFQTDFPEPFIPEKKGELYHSLSIWSSGNGGPVIAAITLFTFCKLSVVLSANYHGDAFGIADCLNLLEHRRATPCTMTVTPPVLPSNWKSARGMDRQKYEEKLGQVLTLMRNQQIDKALRQCAPDEREIDQESLYRMIMDRYPAFCEEHDG